MHFENARRSDTFLLLPGSALKIKVLGPSCISCERTTINVQKALTELNLQADIEEVRKPQRISLYPVSNTPAVLIDEMNVSEGRVPTIEDIKVGLEEVKNWRARRT